MEILNSGVTKFYRSLYSIVEQAKRNGLVIYGAGFWGEISVKIFSLFQVIPTLFCDDDPTKQGTSICLGDAVVPIVSLDEAAQQLPEAVYFAAVTGGGGKDAPRAVMNRRLRERGLLSEYSGFHPVRYLFLLDGGSGAFGENCSLPPQSFNVENIRNMIVFNHMSNSGSAFFGTLMDGHPNVINIAMLGNLVPLKDIYLERLQFLEGDELVLETASQMSPYFTSQFSDDIYFPMLSRLAARFFLNREGQPEKRIYIDPAKFVSSLRAILSNRGRVSFAVLMKAIFAAYANCTGRNCDPNQAYWIFFMRHKENYDMCEMDDLLGPDDFERLEYWFIIREPIQHWFSWLKRFVLEEKPESLWYPGRPEQYVGRLSCDLGLMLEKTERTRGKTVKVIRFEDAKRKTRATMERVCAWMHVGFDEKMLDTTANGIVVYFPSSGKGSGVLSARDTAAVDRKDFSRLLSDYDIFRLNLAFQHFKHTYGYGCDLPDYSMFSTGFLQELYKYPFRFEPELDHAGAEAQRKGYLSVGERPVCHDYIAELLLGYMQQEKHELFSDMLSPQEEETNS